MARRAVVTLTGAKKRLSRRTGKFNTSRRPSAFPVTARSKASTGFQASTKSHRLSRLTLDRAAIVGYLGLARPPGPRSRAAWAAPQSPLPGIDVQIVFRFGVCVASLGRHGFVGRHLGLCGSRAVGGRVATSFQALVRSRRRELSPG